MRRLSLGASHRHFISEATTHSLESAIQASNPTDRHWRAREETRKRFESNINYAWILHFMQLWAQLWINCLWIYLLRLSSVAVGFWCNQDSFLLALNSSLSLARLFRFQIHLMQNRKTSSNSWGGRAGLVVGSSEATLLCVEISFDPKRSTENIHFPVVEMSTKRFISAVYELKCYLSLNFS